MRSGGISQNPRVRAPRHVDAAKGVADREKLLEGAAHRTAAGTAGEHKRTVDVEKNEGRRGGAQPSPRTFPARGPFADGSSSN
jgi:hypothetical protein